MYIAAVLTAESQQRLSEAFSQTIDPARLGIEWKWIAHHMTVEFSKAKDTLLEGYYPEGIAFGMEIKLLATHWKRDDKACAVVVVPTPSVERLRMSNPIPHITVAVAHGVKPFYSNELLASGNLVEFVQPVELSARLVQVWGLNKVIPEITDLATE